VKPLPRAAVWVAVPVLWLPCRSAAAAIYCKHRAKLSSNWRSSTAVVTSWKRGRLQLEQSAWSFAYVERVADTRLHMSIRRPPASDCSAMKRVDQRQPRRFVPLRLAVLFVLLGATAVVLAGRAVQLQLVDHSFLADQGDARFMRAVATAAHRGTITDRFNEPLAVSTPVDSVGQSSELAGNTEQLPRLARPSAPTAVVRRVSSISIASPACGAFAATGRARSALAGYLRRESRANTVVIIRPAKWPDMCRIHQRRRCRQEGAGWPSITGWQARMAPSA
jgi:cell division protein FtsL